MMPALKTVVHVYIKGVTPLPTQLACCLIKVESHLPLTSASLQHKLPWWPLYQIFCLLYDCIVLYTKFIHHLVKRMHVSMVGFVLIMCSLQHLSLPCACSLSFSSNIFCFCSCFANFLFIFSSSCRCYFFRCLMIQSCPLCSFASPSALHTPSTSVTFFSCRNSSSAVLHSNFLAEYLDLAETCLSLSQISLFCSEVILCTILVGGMVCFLVE